VSLTELVELLERRGSVASEDITGLTELDHGLQCACRLADRRPLDAELQVAGLVHDVGHVFGPDDRHAELGGELLRPLLGERVASLVEAHVVAKRYLVATDRSYSQRLSSVSAATLMLQGGPLADGEVSAFRASPWFEDAIELRSADESAKVPGRTVPELAHWLEPLAELSNGVR
jgi:predicted HD phosphohydrolase